MVRCRRIAEVRKVGDESNQFDSMDGLVLASLERLIERRMGNDTEGAMSCW